jgi:hypothetical protein
MRIDIRRYESKPNMLVCTRVDGTSTFQSYGNQSDFFPVHDLTHVAVETILSFSEGFFGMIASGRDVSETEGEILWQGHMAERLVGILMLDGLGSDPSLEEILGTINPALAADGFPPLELTHNQLTAIRKRRDELVLRWHSLPNDDCLSLDFPG